MSAPLSNRRRFMAHAGAAASALAFPLVGGAQPRAIRVGVLHPVTGALAYSGQQCREGALMAIEDINKAGGILGQKVVLVEGDDASDPKQGVSVANKFSAEGVKAVVGHFNSGVSIPASEVYAESGIVQITPASTNPKFTEEGSWNTLRTCGRDDQQGKVSGHTLATEFKDSKLAILHDNSTYGKGIADETKKNANAEGKQEVIYTAYVPGERDYTALISRLKEAGIDVIYIGGYHTEIGLIARQAKEQGLKAQILGPDSLQTNEFWQIAGDGGEGVMMTFPADPRKRPTAAAVLKEFKDQGFDPEGYTLFTYAAVQVWAEAAQKAGSIDPKKVAAELKADGPWGSVLGPLSFDSKGDVTKADYVWSVWHKGTYAER